LDYCASDFESASKILNQLIQGTTDKRSAVKIQKVLLLLLHGQFYGLDTLHQLLKNYGIESNDYQKLWSSLPCNYLLSIVNQWLWLVFGEEFKKRISQSKSTQSRQKLTISIDGSIFKTWLQGENFGQYFGKYYSGQYNSVVHGFNVVLCGMSIGDIFYPLHFQLGRKGEQVGVMAHSILKRVYKKLNNLAFSLDLTLPTLYLSVDSGFRDKGLIHFCAINHIIYIGVPVSSHVIYLDSNKPDRSSKFKIKELKRQFLEKEALYLNTLEESGPPCSTITESFVWRIRGYYNCLNQEVTLLLFRLKGSKKVSVIFTPDLNIKAKTLRQHWFNRTKIELFFRSIKHSLSIQKITIRNRLGFLKKLIFSFAKALYGQFFTQKAKKKGGKLKRMGFDGMKDMIIFHQIHKEFMDDLVVNYTFCKGKSV